MPAYLTPRVPGVPVHLLDNLLSHLFLWLKVPGQGVRIHWHAKTLPCRIPPTCYTVTVPTKQEVFDTIVKHLAAQGIRSIDSRGNCAYRAKGADGEILKCAAGAVIPDDRYSVEIEGFCVRRGEVWNATGLPKEFKELVGLAQNIHDHEHVSEWEVWFEALANTQGLTMPEVEWKIVHC